MTRRRAARSVFIVSLFACLVLAVAGVAYVLTSEELGEQRHARYELPVDVAVLKRQHEYYLEHGVLSADKGRLPPSSGVFKDIVLPAPQEIEPAAGHDQEISREEYGPKEMFGPFAPLKVLAPLIKEKHEQKKTVSYTYAPPQGGGKVVIIIDDMGVSSNSGQAEDLPGPVTLSYLPYAEHLAAHAKRAKAHGHELMLHMPMQPMSDAEDGGPAVLRVDQDREEFLKILHWGLDSFDGYVGVNNHMGSKLTQDAAAMHLVMEELKARGLYFIDSKTIAGSVAAQEAARVGLPYAERDVFLDHDIKPDFIHHALGQVEDVARRKGYAIAIGHPHSETLEALREWIPTLKEKGLTLVPASAVIKHVQEPQPQVAQSQ